MSIVEQYNIDFELEVKTNISWIDRNTKGPTATLHIEYVNVEQPATLPFHYEQLGQVYRVYRGVEEVEHRQDVILSLCTAFTCNMISFKIKTGRFGALGFGIANY